MSGAPVTPLWPRILLQVLFIALVWWSGIHFGGRAGSTALMPAGRNVPRGVAVGSPTAELRDDDGGSA